MTRRVVIVAALIGLLMALAGPASAVLHPAAELMPDGLERPTIDSVELLAPGAHNDLLEADLVIDAGDDTGLRAYEYRWNRGTHGTIHRTSVVDPRVSFEDVLPETAYALEVRAIDQHGWESDWYPAWSGVTPSAPNLIVAGDSVASGYTRQWFTGDATCRDDAYSYGSTIRTELAASLPAAWAPDYTNIAFPGAGVGDMVNGGSDSCSDYYPPQVDDISRLTDPTTWNVVVVTAGINSTNWVDVVAELTKDTAFSFTDRGDKAACDEAVSYGWNLPTKRDFITGKADQISADLGATNARVYWTSYYDIVGSRLAPGWTPIGAECQDEMDDALGQLHTALQAGLSDDITWIDLGDLDVDIQRWAGWPHPNPEGHQTIGKEIAAAIIG